MTKAEKARRRRIMAEIDQKADCGGHNHGMSGGGGWVPSGFDWIPMAMMAGIIGRSKNRRKS